MNPHLRTEHQLDVEDFMRSAGYALPLYPMVPPEDVRKLRARLILEEALETIEALGFEISTSRADGGLEADYIRWTPTNDGCDIIEVVDGCCDISVVTTGTLSAFGVADYAMLAEVDRTNFMKIERGRPDEFGGKWVKPPDWKKPKIKELLVLQGYKEGCVDGKEGTEN